MRLELPAPISLDKFCSTPAYLYFESHYRKLVQDYLSHLNKISHKLKTHFAVKSNSNPHLLRFFKDQGFGIDAVSWGECDQALRLGYDASQVVFSGVGKSRQEIRSAINSGISMLNIESFGELEKIMEISQESQRKVSVAVRFNPDIDAQTHPYIATGLEDHKFGVVASEAKRIYQASAGNEWVNAVGLSYHIGSQLKNTQVMKDAAKEAIQFCQNLRRETEIELKVLDIGGGLGISYDDPFKLPPFEAYADYVQFAGDSWRELMGTEPDLHCENGRCLSALGGFLLTQVVGTKRTSRKNFAIVDASITELIRPALYQSEHPIFYWGASSEKRSSKIFEVVGPVCESSDVLSEACSLPDLKEGDPLLIAASGAYGYVMGSFYNNRSLPPEYWIPENGEPVLSRRRVSWSEIFPETTA